MKKYIYSAIVYAILAMIGGVFYREFTKMIGFSGRTTLSLIHTHYFVLGMLFFLVLAIFEKISSCTTNNTRKAVIAYHIGLNLTVGMLIVRGITQVLQITLSNPINASISGIAGIGHIILAISLITLLLQLKKCI